MTLARFRLPRGTRQTLENLARIACPDDIEALGLVDPVVDQVELMLRAFPRYVRAGMVAGLASLEVGAAALPSSRGRTFSRLTRNKQAACFNALWHSQVLPVRQLTKTIKGLLTFGYYEHPVIKERAGCFPQRWIAETARARQERFGAQITAHEAQVTQPLPLVTTAPAPQPASPTTRRPPNLATIEDVTRDLVLSCETVVVGSGAGGSVMAAELAECGQDVILLEEGGYHPTEEFNADVGHAVRTYYRDGGAQLTLGSPPVQYTEGRLVGGSTVINGGMSWPTPPRVLDRWDREHMVEGIRPAEMERYFARVEKFISAAHQDPHTIGRDNQLLKEGADKLGWKVLPNIRNQFHCAGSNNCAFGCPTAAKRSALVTYVPRALAFGARLYANCRVDRLVFDGTRVRGLEARMVHNDGRAGPRVTVHAQRVVVAGGAIHTPALLLRSGIRSPSGRVGMNLTLHPNCKVVALFDENVEGWKGVHQAFQVREFQEEGYLFAAVNLPAGVLSMTTPAYGNELGQIMADYNHIVTAGMLLEDTTSGRVHAGPGGMPVVRYDLSDFDAERLIRGTSLLCELLLAAGARRIYLPFEDVPPVTGRDDVRRLFTQQIPKNAMEVVTVHVMGTAAMGGDPNRHVCDSYGRVYGAEGLYVSDASLFPTPIGVNPMETIMALSTRNAEHILEKQH